MSSLLVTPSSPHLPPPPSCRLRRPRIEAFGLSHPGLVRSGNEDAHLVAADIGLFAVADGMGGAAAGEVASRTTVDVVRAVFEDADLARPRGLAPATGTTGLPLLVAGIEHANACVYAEAHADPSKAGMGTTFTGIVVLEDRLGIAHVGDSRAYLLRGRRLQQLTEDHTLVGELLNAGTMTREEAKRSPFRHVISRAIGVDAEVSVDQRLLAPEAGDTYLLVSDGLHGVVDDDEIAAVLLGEPDLRRAATELVQRANDAGGPDNVTVVIVRVG